MIENGIYTIKQRYFKKFQKIGCKFKDNKSGNRPTFCCIKDKIIEEINNVQETTCKKIKI